MEDEARSLREFILTEGLGRRGTQYPDEVRELAVELCGRMRAAGYTQKQVEKMLGVQWVTLCKWTRSTHAASVDSVRPVAVREESEQRPLVLRSPRGWTVEGLTFEQVRELVR